jgi:hypothetical protein
MYKHLPRQRRLDEDAKKEREKNLQLKGNKKMVQEHIQRTTGKIVTLKLQHYLFYLEAILQTFFASKLFLKCLSFFLLQNLSLSHSNEKFPCCYINHLHE